MGATKRPLNQVVTGDVLGWYGDNTELVAKADAMITEKIARRKEVDDLAAMEVPICEEIVKNVLKCGLKDDEASSVLLLGEAGSGKTRIVEWCIRRLRKEAHAGGCIVMRAHGGAYATDVECIRHLASQAGGSLATAPRANASFEEGMEWIRGVLRESLKKATSVVIILDKFEHFCSRARQTLLYNLFDIAQSAGVRLSIIGTSEKMDVMNELEKRIKSRFSMRHLHTFLPTTMDGLVQALMARLRLPSGCGLKAQFLAQFHSHIEAALFSQRSRWIPHIECGRPPLWFLSKCLPVASLLQDVGPAPCLPAGKRLRMGPGRCLPSSTAQEAQAVLLEGLSEAEHVVLLSLLRLGERQGTRTLSSVLHEIQLMHDGCKLLTDFVPDRYAAAFDRLTQQRLIEVGNQGTGDVSKKYAPCRSLADRIYSAFVRELAGPEPSASLKNPLRSLPMPVQQWATRQRTRQMQGLIH